MSARTTRARPPRGMTLLELLVALSCAALLMALLGSALMQSQYALARVASEAGQAVDRASSEQLLRALLQRALAPRGADDPLAFVGRIDEMEFTSDAPDALRDMGAVRVRLYVEPAADGARALVAQLTPLGAAGRLALDPRTQAVSGRLLLRLVPDVSAVRFEYVDGSGPAAAVATAWQNRERLPSLTRLQWSRALESQPQGLTVAARRSAHPLCAAQLAPMSCGSTP